jgi:hypothetical protein
MPDTKRGREEQARHRDRRQRERDIEQAREWSTGSGAVDDEPEEGDTDTDNTDGAELRTCHRRGCDRPARFHVLERYLEDTGHGAVEATADLCREHAAEESPTRLEHAYENYVFRVEPLRGSAPTTAPDDA